MDSDVPLAALNDVRLVREQIALNLDVIYQHLALRLQSDMIMYTCSEFGPLTNEQLQIIERCILEALDSMEEVNEEKLAEYKKIRHMVSEYTPNLQGYKGRTIALFLDVRRMEGIFSINSQEVADMDVTLREHLIDMKELKEGDKIAYVRLREMYMEFLDLAQVEDEEYDDLEI